MVTKRKNTTANTRMIEYILGDEGATELAFEALQNSDGPHEDGDKLEDAFTDPFFDWVDLSGMPSVAGVNWDRVAYVLQKEG